MRARAPERLPVPRIYRLLLYAYPRAFRERWAGGMTRALAVRLDRAQRLGGRTARWRALGTAIVDLLYTAALERLPFRLRPRLPGPDQPRPRRRSRGDAMPVQLIANLRFALRSLAHQPLLTALIVVTLALGTGGTIAFFAMVDAAVLRPVPYPEPERLVSIRQSSEDFGLYAFPPPLLRELRARTRSYDALVGFSPTWGMTLTEPSEPQAVRAAFVSDRTLELFGARVLEGRLFSDAEYLPGGPPVAVVTDGFWRRHFGDTPWTARTVTLDETAFEIVGVVADLRMPITASTVSASNVGAEVWIPLAFNPFFDIATIPVMNVVGRLAPGIGVEAASEEIRHVTERLRAEMPDASISERIALDPLAAAVSGDARPAVLVLFGAAAVLLLIACANVANLLLARATARTEELAIRASLGATRARLLGQMLAESGLLALLGCLGGLGLAAWLVRILPAIGMLELPPSAAVRMDLRLVGFSIGLVVVTTLLFGLAPALQATRRSTSTIPGTAGRVSSSGAQRLRTGLVVAEVALAVVLLVGAGLLARSFVALTAVDPGFRADGVLAIPIGLGAERWADASDRRDFFDVLARRLEAIPGIERTAGVNRVPMGGGNVFVGVEFEGGNTGGEESINMDRRVVTPGYFRSLGIPLLSGRDFGQTDGPDTGEPVAIVNRAATGHFTGDPIGQRVRLQLRSGPGPWMQVVGVVGDIRHHGLQSAVEPEIYVPYDQAPVTGMNVLAQTSVASHSLIDTIKSTVWQLDDQLPLDGIGPISSLVTASVAEPRTRMLMMQSFAALALALAGIGIAGVVSYAVARRSRDYGIRLALGARAAEVLRLALREGLVPGAIGAAVGIAAALVLSRFVATLLYGTSPTDPLTFIAVTGVLLAIIAIASWIPARRATRVDPVVVLKEN